MTIYIPIYRYHIVISMKTIELDEKKNYCLEDNQKKKLDIYLVN